jgi:hypothetical protein
MIREPLLAVLLLLAGACSENGTEHTDHDQTPSPSSSEAADPEALVEDAVAAALDKKAVLFAWSSTDTRNQGLLTLRGIAYPERKAWIANGRQTASQPHFYREAYEIRSLGTSRWVTIVGDESAECWLAVRAGVALPFFPAMDAGFPALLSALRGLHGLSLDDVVHGGVNAELSLAAAAALIGLPREKALMIPAAAGARGVVPVWLRVGQGNLNDVIMEGTDFVDSARAAGLTITERVERKLIHRHFQVGLGGERSPQRIEAPAAGDVQQTAEDWNRCLYDQ